MRILTVLSFFLLALGTILTAQERPENRPPWERSDDRSSERSNDRTQGRSPYGGGQQPRGGVQTLPMQRGGFPQGMPQPGRGMMSPPGGDQSNRMIEMFRSMDANRNGILEPGEVSGNRRGFVTAIAGRLGVDPNRPINLADLQRRAAANSAASRNNSGNRSDSNRSRSQSATTEPLVPAFGEEQPVETPTLAFGQKAPAPAALAVITSTAAMAQNQAAQTAPATRQFVPYSNLPEDVRENTSLDWFFSYDKDMDGQLTMQEYVGGYGGVWTPAIASEFRFLDRNGDGFATIDEVLLTLKEVDEQRAIEAEAEAERNKTVPSSGSSGNTRPMPPGVRGTPPQSPNVVVPTTSGSAISSERNNTNEQGNSSRSRRGSNTRRR